MAYDFITYEILEKHIAAITLNRPDSLNALNEGLMEELKSALDVIDNDDDIHVWLLAGAPRPDGRPCFSAGVDMKAIAAGHRMHPSLGPGVANMIDSMLTPSIAVIDGVATTGAIELALACDLRVVGEQVQISDWHLKNLGSGVGMWGSPTRWLDIVGPAKTKEIILTGKKVLAEEAHRIGFAQSVFSSDQLWDGALDLARAVAAMNPAGVRMALAHIQHSIDMSVMQSLAFAPEIKKWFGVTDNQQTEQAQGVMSKNKQTS